MLSVCPLSVQDANKAVKRWHRHHQPVMRGMFALGVVDEQGLLRGAAIVARPVARALDDGWTCEVKRVSTDGTRNACSKLLGAAWRGAQALGWRRCITYTLDEESGSSLRGAGWRAVGEVNGRAWANCSRRGNKAEASAAQWKDKIRWEVVAHDYDPARPRPLLPVVEVDQQDLFA